MEPTQQLDASRGSSISAASGALERALLVSSAFPATEAVHRMGQEAYSYRFVYQAFQPLLQRWGWMSEVIPAESRLEYAAWQAAAKGQTPVHLSFQPLHLVYLTRRAPNVAFPFWEFPDIPNISFQNNARNDWVRIANLMAMLLTANTFTRDAFARAGVTTPIRIVPVPVQEDYFSLPSWVSSQSCTLPLPCYVFPQADPAPVTGPSPWARARRQAMSLRARIQHAYKTSLKPRLPEHIRASVNLARRSFEAALRISPQDTRIAFPAQPGLELGGVVYTSIFNPFDPRKNWPDLISAFLLALRDCADATLVIKVVASPRQTALALNGMLGYYQALGLRHRCKLVFLPGYLSDEQMLELTKGSTYYVNTARAEGACLPLQSFLAASRPGIAPIHTAMTDYFHEGIGFVVDSHPEPACWPHDPTGRCTTTWHRLVWQTLHDQFQASYTLATRQPERYRALAARGRQDMAAFASAEEVWPRLAGALEEVLAGPPRQAGPTLWRHPAVQRVAT